MDWALPPACTAKSYLQLQKNNRPNAMSADISSNIQEYYRSIDRLALSVREKGCKLKPLTLANGNIRRKLVVRCKKMKAS